ncbi:unnamed protein product [Echinostoma caproni]|uniref:C2H2-type domain-containing protein n=1 Tax=Echinostoma caproni TaxID=27848 RepID=A0A183B459_9TREM|nr:unnamed protein product [Echinostoma caproni]
MGRYILTTLKFIILGLELLPRSCPTFAGRGHDYYKDFRNQCPSKQRWKRAALEDSLAATASNGLFAYPRRRTRVPTTLPPLLVQGALKDDPGEQVDLFSRHYALMYESAEPFPEGLHIQGLRSPTLAVLLFNPREVQATLENLNINESPGPDGLHPKVLKELAVVISVPLWALFNSSLKYGRLPEDWKIALISPLFKSGSRADPAKYRPNFAQLQDQLVAKTNRLTVVRRECHRRRLLLLAQQQLMDSGPQTYHRCMYCSKAFLNASFLAAHVHRRHPETEVSKQAEWNQTGQPMQPPCTTIFQPPPPPPPQQQQQQQQQQPVEVIQVQNSNTVSGSFWICLRK